MTTEAAQAGHDRASGVVVGVDGSEANRAALEWAADAAASHGLPLTLAFARPDAAGVRHEVTPTDGVLGVATELARARHPALDVRALQLPYPPVQSLLAAGELADLVVLGSRGLGGFRGLLVGSTTMHVAHYARSPVVVVHDRETRPSEVPVVDPRNPGKVVLGYDGSSAANRASAFGFRHAAAIGSGVVVVSVDPDRGEPEVREVHPDRASPGSDTSAFHAPLVVTAASFPDVPLTFVSGTGRPAEVLLQEGAGCALLVVGSRGQGGFAGLVMGSVSQKVLVYADCPVAVVHARVSATAASGVTGAPPR